jgi:hypothetical protein
MGTKTQKLSNIVDQIVEWQAVKTADGSWFNAVAGEGYFVNTTSGAITVTLPASPSIGDTISIKDYAGTFATNKLTIDRNGKNIQGVANNSQISTARASVVLVFIDDTKGWLFTNESNVADLQEELFITATGGTITTSGDYKIHTFTGDADFVVSSLGNSPVVPTGGPNNVDYLVVAGGGAGGSNGSPNIYGSGGGGAGGYRESSGTTSGSYTVSPLGGGVSALTVSVQSYPITVGAGAATLATPDVGPSGSPSSFSSITSAGGGGGGSQALSPSPNVGQPGGSGGGGASAGGPGGTGNTPPTSPSQGTNGGSSTPSAGASGGGGATVAAENAPPSNGSPGGAGATSSINGTPTARAGGGGGGAYGGPAGTGGTGGGGNGGTAGPLPGAQKK